MLRLVGAFERVIDGSTLRVRKFYGARTTDDLSSGWRQNAVVGRPLIRTGHSAYITLGYIVLLLAISRHCVCMLTDITHEIAKNKKPLSSISRRLEMRPLRGWQTGVKPGFHCPS